MARGTDKSDWTVAYNPRKKQHLPYDNGYYSSNSPVEYWAADLTFTAALVFKDYERGRSSVTVLMEDGNGWEYSMFLAEFMRLVPEMRGGVLVGQWGFVKNGSNTGIVKVDAVDSSV